MNGAPLYEVHCMGLPCGQVDLAVAAEMFVQNPFGRRGDLESGYCYWVCGEHVKRLVRVDVYPVRAPRPARM